jgi:hypothetical protein
VKIALDIEPFVYEVNTLLNAAGLINRITNGSFVTAADSSAARTDLAFARYGVSMSSRSQGQHAEAQYPCTQGQSLNQRPESPKSYQ